MQLYTKLDIITLLLATIHFGVPLMYYYYAKTQWLPKSWNIRKDNYYEPEVTIIVPTYNEEDLIKRKLDNIYLQKYPKEKIEVILIDSASTDRTVFFIKDWVRKYTDINLKLIQEDRREGKGKALNKALQHTTNNGIIIISDTDALWPSEDTIKKTVIWFADPIVGAVSCIKKPYKKEKTGIEDEYRDYYNYLRLAESKAWSTPIFHGELAAFKKKHLLQVGGFPTDIGADDSHTATRIALKGNRAIIPENLVCMEMVPQNGYHSWKIRRAQHLIQHMFKILFIEKDVPIEFKIIIYLEVFLHLVNPWLFLATIIMLLLSITMSSILATIILGGGILLLLLKLYRTWIINQLYLIVAAIKNLFNRNIIWEKQAKAEFVVK